MVNNQVCQKLGKKCSGTKKMLLCELSSHMLCAFQTLLPTQIPTHGWVTPSPASGHQGLQNISVPIRNSAPSGQIQLCGQRAW